MLHLCYNCLSRFVATTVCLSLLLLKVSMCLSVLLQPPLCLCVATTVCFFVLLQLSVSLCCYKCLYMTSRLLFKRERETETERETDRERETERERQRERERQTERERERQRQRDRQRQTERETEQTRRPGTCSQATTVTAVCNTHTHTHRQASTHARIHVGLFSLGGMDSLLCFILLSFSFLFLFATSI